MFASSPRTVVFLRWPNEKENSPVLGTQPQVEGSYMKLAAAVAAVVAADHHSDRRSHGPGRSMSPSGFVAGGKVSTKPSFFLPIFEAFYLFPHNPFRLT